MLGPKSWRDAADQWPLPPLIVATFAVPYLIAYLSFTPSTRWIRITIWPISVLSYLAVLGRIGVPLVDMRFAHNGMMVVFGSGIRYTFTSTPPIIHSLPREPALGSFRKTRVGKAFHLLYSEQRRVGIAPNPPITRQGLSYLAGAVLQLVRFLACIAIFDTITYPIVYFAPTTYGSIQLRDYPSFVDWVKNLAAGYGVPWWIVWTMFAWSYATGSVFGFEMGAHLTAFIMIGIGYNLEAEWPKVSDWWMFKPSSLNEFWGKRYHRLLREPLLFWASPFENGSRSVHILATFFGSVLFHLACYGALNRRLPLVSMMTFFMGQGLACVFERYLLRYHGIRVHGLIGRIWMTAVLTLTAIPLINEHHEMGWAGAIRCGFEETPQSSIVQWFFYATGRPNLISGRKVQ